MVAISHLDTVLTETKLLIGLQFFSDKSNNKGYNDDIDGDNIPTTPNTIIFTKRDVVTYSNSISGKYSV
jgi:hypothetical protein